MPVSPAPTATGAKVAADARIATTKVSVRGMGSRKNRYTTVERRDRFFAAISFDEIFAYFQSYTNTYDSVDKLIELYREALSYPDVVGLVISTRPDCMPDELLDYLEKLNRQTFVLVEYGVESTLDRTLERVNRCHTWEDSQNAIRKTVERGIATGAHLILGLPGESKDEMLGHAARISALPLTTIKLHQLQIIKGTALARDYRRNPSSISLFSLDEYIDLCVSFAERLNPELYIERFASQSPKELLIAPDWGLKNYELTDRVVKRFAQRDTYQGKFFGQ